MYLIIPWLINLLIPRNDDKEKRHITSCDMPPVLFCRITCVMSLIT